MVRGKKKKILTYNERVGLEEEKRELEALQRESQEPGRSRSIDQAALSRQIAHLDKEIHEGSAPSIRGVTKDRLAGRARDLEEQLKNGMPTRDEMSHPAKNPGAVRKHMSWEHRNKENIKEYKEIQRQLNPDAPVNIENLRKEK